MVEVKIFKDLTELAEAVAGEFIRIGNQAISEKGRFSTALAGGSTPRKAYQLVTESHGDNLDWSQVHFFWGDERCVPPDRPESNYKMAYDTLLKYVSVPESNINRMKGELEPHQAAEKYQKNLHAFFKDSPGFDLVLLGMGSDGHTASLFPGTGAVFEKHHWVRAYFIPKIDAWRITLTPAIINQSEHVIFMVSGARKASSLKEVLESPQQPERFPAQIIQPEKGTLTWMIDEEAAKMLRSC